MTVGINRTKASSHPTREDGIYLGVVKRVLPNGKAFVYIPKLSNTLGPMRVANIVGNSSLQENSNVLCAHVGGGTEEMYVIGHITKLILDYTTALDVSSLLRDAQLLSFMDVS